MNRDNEFGTLSIIMPVYNTGRLLLESVDSVLRQDLFKTMPPQCWELLLCDDRSTDPETLAALDEAQRRSPNIRLLKNTRSQGPAGARNAGIFHSQAEWIAFLDSDDLWYEDSLSNRFDVILSCPAATWISGQFKFMGTDGNLADKPLSEKSPGINQAIGADHKQSPPTLLTRPVSMLLSRGCLQVMTCLLRRSILLAVNGFDETFPTAEDYDLWLRLAVSNDLYVVPHYLGLYRRRADGITLSGRPTYLCEDRMIYKALAQEAFAPYRAALRGRLPLVYRSYCYYYRAGKMRWPAVRYAFKFLRIAPLSIEPWKHLAAALIGR